jgi:hypothetical protein
MSELLQQLINGLSLGAIYALIALGYTMVYGVLRFINFAHSDVFMVGRIRGLLRPGSGAGRFHRCRHRDPHRGDGRLRPAGRGHRSWPIARCAGVQRSRC